MWRRLQLTALVQRSSNLAALPRSLEDRAFVTRTADATDPRQIRVG